MYLTALVKYLQRSSERFLQLLQQWWVGPDVTSFIQNVPSLQKWAAGEAGSEHLAKRGKLRQPIPERQNDLCHPFTKGRSP